MRNSHLTAVRRAGRDVLINLSTFHNEDDAPERGEIIKRITVDRNDVGFHAGREDSDLVLHADGFRCPGSCRDDGFHGRLSTVPKTNLTLRAMARLNVSIPIGMPFSMYSNPCALKFPMPRYLSLFSM